MRYLQTYEKYVEYTYSEILNRILNKITEPFHGYKCSIKNKMFDPSNPNCYWVLCEFTAKSGIEASGNRGIYNIIIDSKKEQLEKFEEINDVKYNSLGRLEPLEPGSKQAGYHLAKKRLYEFYIYLTNNAVNEIELEFDYHKSIEKYNL